MRTWRRRRRRRKERGERGTGARARARFKSLSWRRRRKWRWRRLLWVSSVLLFGTERRVETACAMSVCVWVSAARSMLYCLQLCVVVVVVWFMTFHSHTATCRCSMQSHRPSCWVQLTNYWPYFACNQYLWERERERERAMSMQSMPTNSWCNKHLPVTLV